MAEQRRYEQVGKALGAACQAPAKPDGTGMRVLLTGDSFAPGAEQFAFCDMSLPTKDRVEDLLTRFTLDEKLGMISPNPMLGDTCVGTTWNGTSFIS